MEEGQSRTSFPFRLIGGGVEDSVDYDQEDQRVAKKQVLNSIDPNVPSFTGLQSEFLHELTPIQGIYKDLINLNTSSQFLAYDPSLVSQIAKLRMLKPGLPYFFQTELELQLTSRKMPQFLLSPKPANTTTHEYISNSYEPTIQKVTELKKSSSLLPSIHTLRSMSTDGNIFALLTQPNDVQRKAYEKESRYVLPNPLKLGLIAHNTKIEWTHCQAMVYLVDKTKIHSEGEFFQSANGLPLPPNANSEFSFSLQIFKTSGKVGFRFLFQIDYLTSGEKKIEWIISDPFIVVSNRIRIIQAKMREAKKQEPKDPSPDRSRNAQAET